MCILSRPVNVEMCIKLKTSYELKRDEFGAEKHWKFWKELNIPWQSTV